MFGRVCVGCASRARAHARCELQKLLDVVDVAEYDGRRGSRGPTGDVAFQGVLYQWSSVRIVLIVEMDAPALNFAVEGMVNA